VAVTLARPERRPASTAAAAIVLGWRAGGLFWTCTVGLALVTGLFAPASAWILAHLVNDLTGSGRDGRVVAALAAAAVVMTAISFSMSNVSALASAAMQRRMSLTVTSDLFAAVNRIQGLTAFERPGFQDRLRLAERSAEQVPESLTSALSAILQGGVTVAAYAGILIATWPPMILMLIAASLPTIAAQLFLTKRSVRTSEAVASHYRQWYLLRGLLSEPRAVMEIRLLGLGDFFRARLVRALGQAKGAEYKISRATARTQVALAVLGGLITAVGAVFVALRAARGDLGTGGLVLFLAAVTGTQGMLIGLVDQTIALGGSLQLLRHYVAVLRGDDDAPLPASPASPAGPASPVTPAVSPRHQSLELRDGIELRDVWFRYDPGSWVLRGLNAVVPFGKSVALVGVNGSGKSTLIKLLCRLYDPQRGSIFWDGIDLRDLDPVELRRRIAVTFQDFMTYDMTIGQNIGIGQLKASADRSRIIAAAQLADVHAHISGLRKGYDSMLSKMFLDEDGDKGTLLSGGQNQRLALARTLMRDDADLIVLDEPSSGLDAQAEHQIHQRLQDHRRGRTSLLVSHRLSAVREADQILVLQHGEITERGTHDQLMSSGGHYARLFSLQAAGYQDDRVHVHRQQSG
jgi:ATP-binding cassette, subfamily B, bacterial